MLPWRAPLLFVDIVVYQVDSHCTWIFIVCWRL